LKKVSIWIVSIIFTILTTTYLIVNSSYVFDKLAKKYAPQFGFSYDRIEGNPISGIKLLNLKYENRLLADRIQLHINPYKLIKGNIALSRLELRGVSVSVLESLIAHYSKGDEIEKKQDIKSEEKESSSLPIGIELNNIHLSLKPFTIMGVYISKENLNIDHITYSSGKFIVGELSQEATTSLGDITLKGSFHKRVLNLKLLRIDDLKLQKLMALIDDISKSGNSKESPDNNESSDSDSSSNIFIPKEVKAKKLIFTMNPYEIYGQEVSDVVLKGKDIDLNIEKMLINAAKLHLNIKSTIANLDTDIECQDDSCSVNDITLDRIKVNTIIALSKELSKDSNKSEDNSSTVIADLPFVPDTVEIKAGDISLVPEKIEGVEYSNAGIKISNLFVDLRDEKLTLNSLLLNADTDVAKLRFQGGIDSNSIDVKELNLSHIDIDKIISLIDKNKSPSDKKEKPKEESAKSKSGDIDIPYLPKTLNIDTLTISTLPYKTKDIKLNSDEISIKDTSIDISKLLFKNGLLSISADTDLAKAEISGILQDRELVLNQDSSFIQLKQRLMDRYKAPIDAKALKPIRIGGVLNEKIVDLDIKESGNKIYADKKAGFDIDTNISIKAKYDIAQASLNSTLDADTNIPPFVNGVKLHTLLNYDKKGGVKYSSQLRVSDISALPKKVKPLLKGLNIKVVGSDKRFNAILDSNGIEGAISSKDMKTAYLKLNTKHKIRLSQYTEMPKKLSKSWAKVQLTSKINLKKPLPIKVDFNEVSNLANLKGSLKYKNSPTIDAIVTIPKHSLLYKFDKNLQLKSITPAKISLKPQKDKLKLTLNAKVAKLKADYNTKSKKIDSKIDIADSTISINGKIDGDIKAKLSSRSVKKLFSNLSKIYKFTAPKINGDLTVAVTLNKDKTVSAKISSKKFIPDENTRIKNPITNLNIAIKGNLEKKLLTIERYSVNVSDMKIFAKKPSTIFMDKSSVIQVKDLWVNDSLDIKGKYDTKRANGKFIIKAKRFKINHKNAKITLSINNRVVIKKGKINVDGKVTILGGRVYYNMQTKHYASDDDIIIVQHMKKNSDSFFEKNVKLSILIESKKPLLFKQKDVKVELKPSMSIIKEYNSPLMVLGSIDLKKGGYYKFEGKKFVLEKSAIYFTGKATQPLLNIRLVYRRYSKTIWITVTGTGTEPALNFSSSPYMTRDQILSFILFDTETSSNSSEEMLSMVGGGLAKSILGNMGLKLDTLVLSQNGFEVGKKITDKISVIYDQQDESKIIVRIEHSPKVETDISVGQDSQSIDIIYKREY